MSSAEIFREQPVVNVPEIQIASSWAKGTQDSSSVAGQQLVVSVPAQDFFYGSGRETLV